MPSKRTNDSVDQILEELNREQAAKGIRDGVTDSNVDEILRGIPRSTAPVDDITATLGPIPEADMPKVEVSADLADPEARFSTQTINDLLGDLPIFQQANQQGGMGAVPPPVRRPAAPPEAPRPEQSRPEQPAAARRAPPAQETRTLRPEPQPEQPAAGTGTSTTVDTTRTGVISKFLVQAGGEEDKAELSQRKDQFKRFFGRSIAVVPEENGKLPPEKKPHKRGIFGLSGDTSEITNEFVPINVPIKKPVDESGPQPAGEDGQPAGQQPARKKRGFFSSLFGGRGSGYEDTAELDMDSQEAEAPEEAAPQPEAQPEKYVYHSKYAGRRHARGGLDETVSRSLGEEPPRQPEEEPEYWDDGIDQGGREADPGAYRQDAEPEDTRADLYQQPEPRQQEPAGRGTEPEEQPEPRRKKRDTLEFTPGQRTRQAPRTEPPAEDEFRATEPVGEPMSTRQDTLTSGFTIDMTRREEREDTHDFIASVPPRAPDDARHPAQDTGTITGQVRLEPVQPDAGQGGGQTGQVNIGDTARPAESTDEFALDFLDSQPEQRPDTEQFVAGIAQTLNTQLDDELGSRYGKDAERLAHPEREDEDGGDEEFRRHRSRRKRGAKGPRLGGTPEDEHEPEGDGPDGPFPSGQPRRPTEYETAEDAPRVRRELDNRVLYTAVTSIVSGVAALVMVYLGIAATGSILPLPAMLVPVATAETAAAAASGIQTVASAAPLMTVLLVLLLAVCALNWETMFRGLAGLLRDPTADTMPALAAVGAVVQLLVFLIQPGWYVPSQFCLLAGPAALLLCGNAVGKQFDARTTRANFDLVSAGVNHAVAYRLRDAAVLRTVTRGLGEPKPNLLVSRPTLLLKHFLAGSGAHRTSDKNQQQFSWVVGACALLCLVFTLAYRQDPGMAFTAFAVVLCLGAPLSGTLISALPARLMQRSAARVGAVIPGWKDIRQLGRINVIQITAKDLFPTGCITLSGIRAVDNKEIENIIVYVVSIMSQTNSPLRDVLLGMVGDNRKLLAKVDDLKTEDGLGYVGWIDGKRILVGNRALMEKYGVKIPDAAFEARRSINQRRLFYLACSGSLMAIFQVNYQRDPDTAAVLESLRQVGISIIVDCDDFNCDVRLVEAVYGLPSGSVKVLNAEEREALTPATAWLPESDGNMLHLGSFASFVGGLEAAAGAAERESISSMVMAASVLVSCLMAVIMSLAGGVATLPVLVLVLYQLVWAFLTLVIPNFLRRG